MSHPGNDAPDGVEPQAKPKGKRASKAVVVAPAAPPQGLAALFERAASVANFDVDQLAKWLAIKREVEADAERRAFDSDFAQLQAELVRVEANAYDPQKRRAYADINALTDAVGPLVAAKGFIITYDAAPSAVEGAVRVTVKLLRGGVERTASADVPMDGHGMRGGANMSAPQAYGSTITYGRKLALTLLFGLTVAKQASESSPPPRLPERRHDDDAPPWDEPPHGADHLAVLKRAAAKSDNPPSDKQVEYLASLMRQRGEPPESVLDGQGRLNSRAAWQAIDARKGVR